MNLNNLEAEYLEISKRSAWPLVYQKIGLKCQAYAYSCTEAKKPQNKPLNRYRDVSPYDHSRVILQRSEKDYINANLIKVERANRKYILTQGPLVFTVSHFWLMVWEQNSRAILMLNKVLEKNEVKCYWYWPLQTGEQHKMTLEDVNLTVEQLDEVDNSYYSTRLIKITDLETNESREVIHFHYTTWPDFGVPQSPIAFLKFLKTVRESGALEPDVGPPVVHCSAGIGRSGTFCLVDTCLVIIQREGMDNLNIQQILLEMRKDRMGLIQTPDQLRFSYQAIIEGARRLDPNFNEEEEEENIYAVVDQNEDSPPPPPPRGESLARAPARPLPAIPTSASFGNLILPLRADESSSSDEAPPTPPSRQLVSLLSAPSLSMDDNYDEAAQPQAESSGTENENSLLRRRRAKNKDLAERVSLMKKRGREAEHWHSIKRSLYKPLTITFGFIVAGFLIYSYVKH